MFKQFGRNEQQSQISQNLHVQLTKQHVINYSSCLAAGLKGNSKAGLCGTCNKRIDECVGHFGHVSLALPVFHAGFMRRDSEVVVMGRVP